MRKEWTEWHLTPRGWESGSTRHGDGGNQWRDEPQDRVLSAVYKEQQTSSQPAATCGIEESWRAKDPAKADSVPSLLARYGPCPARLT